MYFGQVVEFFQALESIILLCFYKGLGILYIIIYKGKEVAFFAKFLEVNRINKIYVNKLVKAFYSFLLIMVIHFSNIDFLITIANVVI